MAFKIEEQEPQIYDFSQFIGAGTQGVGLMAGTGLTPRQINVSCLVDTLNTSGPKIHFFRRWERADIGDNGICSIKEANDYVRSISNTPIEGIPQNPLHYLLRDQTMDRRGRTIYSFEEFSATDNRDRPQAPSGYLHIRVTPGFSLE